MKILMVSPYFPPYSNMGSLRVGKMAKFLMKFGHEVKVICAHNEAVLCDLDLEIPAENVTYTRYFRLTLSKLSASVQDGVVDSKQLYDFIRKSWRVFRSVLYFPDDFIGWVPHSIRAAEKILRTWMPDIIYAGAPPHSSLLAVSYVASKFKIPWIADLRDLWTDNHCYAFGRLRRKIERRVEYKTLSSAGGLVTVSEPLAEKLKNKFSIPVKVICNGFDPDDYATVDKDIGSKEPAPLRIVYTGRINRDFQDPSPFFLALKSFKKGDIKVSFYGGSFSYYRNLAKKNGVKELVEFNDRVPYKKSLELQMGADILLLFVWTDLREKGVYTGKLLEYIGSKRLILGIGPFNGVAANLIKDRRLGMVLDRPKEIEEFLASCLHEKKKVGSLSSIPEKSQEGFSREEQARDLEKFMREIIKTHTI